MWWLRGQIGWCKLPFCGTLSPLLAGQRRYLKKYRTKKADIKSQACTRLREKIFPQSKSSTMKILWISVASGISDHTSISLPARYIRECYPRGNSTSRQSSNRMCCLWRSCQTSTPFLTHKFFLPIRKIQSMLQTWLALCYIRLWLWQVTLQKSIRRQKSKWFGWKKQEVFNSKASRK